MESHSVNDEDLPSRLRSLAMTAGAEDLAADALALADQVREARFYLACVGQFKRGKSTLLNALVGQSVLPTGVTPVTSAVTILRHGPAGVRVRTRAGWVESPIARLPELVTEDRNPGNAKGVLTVEVLLPVEALRDGLCLVDTPGLGSVIEANGLAAREFLPHIDAALVVLGTDPPISGEELRLVGAIAEQTDILIFVINKVDRVVSADSVEAAEFTRQLLVTRLGLGQAPIYRVSALDGGGPDWEALAARVHSLATSHRARLVAAAHGRGVSRVGSALAGRLRERRAALVRPLEESERRVEALRGLGESTGRALRDLGPLLGAEEQRLADRFTRRAGEFLAEARTAALAKVRQAWATGRFEGTRREEELEAANEVARSLLQPWLRQSEVEAAAAYQEGVHQFTALANDLVARLIETAGLDPGVPPRYPAGRRRDASPVPLRVQRPDELSLPGLTLAGAARRHRAGVAPPPPPAAAGRGVRRGSAGGQRQPGGG